MMNVMDNVRDGLRSIRKSPGLTVTILLTLALGIGATTAIFSANYAVLLAPIPVPHADRLVIVWSTRQQDKRYVVAAADYRDWTERASSFESLAASAPFAANIASRDEPEYIPGNRTTVGRFRLMGSRFSLGRDFLPEEGRPGADHVVILTHKLWERFGADARIIGKPIRLNGEPYTVVGVLSPGFPDLQYPQFSVPLVFDTAQINHDYRWLFVEGRLKPGVTLQQAQADMDRVAARLAEAYPRSNKGFGAYVESFSHDWHAWDRKSILVLLMGGVGFVLLIGCVNVINLLLAKAATREREIAIRGSLGASARTIFVQLVTEHLLLVTLGGVLGVATGYVLLRALLAVATPLTIPAPEAANVRLSLPVLLFTLGATTVAALLVGCAPAWVGSGVDPAEALKEGERSGKGLRSRRVRRALVIGEFALALSLLAGAALATHSFLNVSRVDLGVRTDHVLTFYLDEPDSRPKDPDQIISYYRRILASIEGVPGVSSVAASLNTPLVTSGASLAFTVAGQQTLTDRSQRPMADFGLVTPDYFATYGIRLLKGRLLSDQDVRSSVKVAVVNEYFADHFFHGRDPLGQRVVIDEIIPGIERRGPPVEYQIVGVVHNVRYGGFRRDEPEVDLPLWQVPWPSGAIGVRTTQDPESMTKSVAAAVHAIDADIALAFPRTMEQVRSEAMGNDRFALILFSSFAAIALLLASIGIYGVMAFSVHQRLHEMAIRTALGANRLDVIRLVVIEGTMMAGTGLGVGVLGAYFVGRLMKATLFGVGAIDVPGLSAVGMVLLAAALLACSLPAYRAASAHPLEALRGE